MFMFTRIDGHQNQHHTVSLYHPIDSYTMVYSALIPFGKSERTQGQVYYGILKHIKTVPSKSHWKGGNQVFGAYLVWDPRLFKHGRINVQEYPILLARHDQHSSEQVATRCYKWLLKFQLPSGNLT